MELEESYKNITKEFKAGNLKAILLITPSETEMKTILMGEKMEMVSGLIISMYENKDIENLITFCAKNFGSYKKEMDKKCK